MYESLIGRRFGKFEVVKQAESRHWKRRWICKCVCGVERTVSTEHLASGKRTGCNSCNNGYKKRPFESLYNFLISQAKNRTVVDLTYEEYLGFTKKRSCHYCGTPLLWRPHAGSRHGHKLDRKDNTLGYSKDNCVVCCPRCNCAKSDHFTYSEWKQIGELIKKWRSNGNDQKNVGTEKES